MTRIKLDENLSRYLKPELERRGHDVHTAAEEGLSGKSDAVVGAAARREKRMLFTLDIEFADMRKHPRAIMPASCCSGREAWAHSR